MSPHLVVALSAHGFGHIGQTAPVIHAVQQRLPGLRITIRTSAPQFKLRERFGPGVVFEPADTDIGMLQANALEVSVENSAQAYSSFHEDWEAKVEQEAKYLDSLGATVLLANVPYLALAGASLANITSIALCSLNWLEIYRYYYENRDQESHRIMQQMLTAYNSAQCFLQPAPSMPMPQLSNIQPIGPIAQLGQNRRDEIVEKIGLKKNEQIILVSLGGMELRFPVENWPKQSGLRFLLPTSWKSEHPSTVALESLDIPFADLMQSCDVLIAKPGYGSFVEAACAQVPVLYLERPNWPEAPYLISWLEQHGRCMQLPLERLQTGDMRDLVDQLYLGDIPPATEPTGVEEAADHIVKMLT